jgi:NAD(P)-dependent dehydrogenase (short-subunit alcohol dehydrogenase family)
MGRTTALALAREGASVVLADVSDQGNQETDRMITELGVRGPAVRCDVTRSADVQAALNQAVDAFGRLDSAFNTLARRTKAQRDPRCHRRGMGPDHRHQPPQRVPVYEIRDPTDAGAWCGIAFDVVDLNREAAVDALEAAEIAESA